MIKPMTKCVSVAALAMACSAPAYAAPYVLDYTGTTSDSGTPFTTVLDLDLSSDGSVATFISGTRNGVAITGLSGYAGADNRLSFSNPYVSLAGLSYILTGGTNYNFFFDAAGTYIPPAGTPGYGETNSVTDPSGVGTGASRVNFASVNGVTISGAVPEPATWAMMLVGFGMIGFGLRRRSKVTNSVRFA